MNVTLLPKATKMLEELGLNLKLARLRRKISAEQLAARSLLSRKTIWAIENGMPGVGIGAYVQVLFVLGLEKDLLKVASDDQMGRKLQDANLLSKARAPKKRAKPQTK